MACPAGPLERFGAVAYATDQEINPLPHSNQSHSTQERVRDKTVKLPHVVIMVMVMSVFLYAAGTNRKHKITSHHLFDSFSWVVCGGGGHLCGKGEM